jgi:hypothetical protein
MISAKHDEVLRIQALQSVQRSGRRVAHSPQLALSGSPAGWTQTEYEQADEATRRAVRERVTPMFEAAGAHFVIDTVADLPAVLLDIEERLAMGLRP